MNGRIGRVALGGIAVAVAVAAVVSAAPKNGSFESGFSPGWKTYTSDPQSGKWRTYKKGDEPQSGGGPPRAFRGLTELKPFYDPPRGKRAAVTDQSGEGTRILQRNLKLKPNRKIKLSLWVFYRNYANNFFSPNTLHVGGGMLPRGGEGERNQQYRIDLLRPEAPRLSVADSDVLKTLFRTRHGDPRKMKPRKLTFNLTKFGGDTVRIRFAEVDNQLYLHAGTDAIKLHYKPRG